MSWLDKYEDGGPKKKKSLKDFISDQDNRSGSTSVAKQDIRPEPTQAEKNKRELQRRKDAIAASNQATKKGALSREAFAKTAAGDKLRVFPNDPNSIVDEYLNPAKMIGDMADNIGHSWAGDGSLAQKAMSVAMPLGMGTLAGITPGTTNAQFVNNIVNPAAGVTKEHVVDLARNLKDLTYAQSKFGSKYNFPRDLNKIAGSNEETDRLIKQFVDQDNTFTRGVWSGDEDYWKKYAPEVLDTFKKNRIDYINNPEEAARYMATHIPPQTNFGDAHFLDEQANQGLRPLYVSNSEGTADAYTIGDGYRVKVQRPTDYSSTNRQDWIDKNKIDYDYEKFNPDPSLRKNILKTDHFPTDNYAHYMFVGTPGEKIFDALEAAKINIPTNKLSRNPHSGLTSEGYSMASATGTVLGSAALYNTQKKQNGGQWLDQYGDGGPKLKKPGNPVAQRESTRVAPSMIRDMNAYPNQETAAYYNKLTRLLGEEAVDGLRKFSGNAKVSTRPSILEKAKLAGGHYNPWKHAVTVPDIQDANPMLERNIDTLYDELAHANQYANAPIKKTLQWWTNDLPAYLTGQSVYSTPGTVEFEAHSQIAPKMHKKFADGGPKQNRPNPSKVKNFMADYMDSPMFLKRLNHFDDIPINTVARPKDVRSASILHTKDKYSGSYAEIPHDNQVGLVVIDPYDMVYQPGNNKLSSAYNKRPFNYEEVLSHELGHATRGLSNKETERISQLITNPAEDKIRDEWDILDPDHKKAYYKRAKNIGIPAYDMFVMETSPAFIKGTDSNIHDLAPAENKADMDALRYQMYKYGIYDTKKKDLDMPTLQKALQHPKIKESITTRRLLLNLKPEALLKLNNEIAGVNKPSGIPLAKDGGQSWLNKYPDGGQKKKIQPIPSRTSSQDNTRIPSAVEADMSKKMNAYYNPEVRDVTSGDPQLDFLYKNQGLFKLPIIGDMIRDKAYETAKNSGGAEIVEPHYEKVDYTGAIFNPVTKKKGTVNMVDQYFGKINLPKSKYTPKSDYLSFLPSVSIKDNNFDKINKDLDLTKALSEIDPSYQKKGYDLNNKDKIQAISLDQRSELSYLLNTDLGGHKIGVAFDKERNLPYMSISDAWDFSPKNYSDKYNQYGSDRKEINNLDVNNLKLINKAYVQASLMHKAGKPFKVYDRFYFDPKTKKYIPDSKLPKKQQGGQTSWLEKYN